VRLTKLVSLTTVAFAVGVAVWPARAPAATGLSGAGSSLVAPLVAEWAAAFQAFHGTSVTFYPVGSQAGIKDVSARLIDFGASDAPMTSAQQAACNGCYQIPWALSAIGISYHVNGLRAGLNLSGEVLAQIYLGHISQWNDRRIRALNPRASLPNLKITPIYATGSGATYAFTLYLSRTSANWRNSVGYGLSASFPAGVSTNSPSAAAALLQSTNGAIAYLGASYLIADRLPAAAIENSAGRFEYPNLSEIESAAVTVRHVPAGNALTIVDPPSSARTAYPIATFSYVIVPGNASNKADLEQWISYGLGAGQAFGPSLDFAQLPPNIMRASTATLSRFVGAH
jgi:phosphate transport system substrate-binding protein